MNRATESDYRAALQAAERALMHASKHLDADTPDAGRDLIATTLSEVTRVLDIGRDEHDEMVLS